MQTIYGGIFRDAAFLLCSDKNVWYKDWADKVDALAKSAGLNSQQAP